MQEKVTKHERHEQRYSNEGEFQPLSFYARLGYDTDRIKNNTRPVDIQENEQLGTTYRVKILRTGEAGAKGKESTSYEEIGVDGCEGGQGESKEEAQAQRQHE